MKEVKTGIVGLGRLGAVHAENLAFKIPGCRLVAACSLEQKELDWAKDYLKVDYVTTDYKKWWTKRISRLWLLFPRRLSTAG